MSISEKYPHLRKHQSEREIEELLKMPMGEVKANLLDEVTRRCEPMFNSPEYQEKLLWKYGGAYFDDFMSRMKDKSAMEQINFIDLEVRRNHDKMQRCDKKSTEYTERASFYKLLMMKYDEIEIMALEEADREDAERAEIKALEENTQAILAQTEIEKRKTRAIEKGNRTKKLSVSMGLENYSDKTDLRDSQHDTIETPIIEDDKKSRCWNLIDHLLIPELKKTGNLKRSCFMIKTIKNLLNPKKPNEIDYRTKLKYQDFVDRYKDEQFELSNEEQIRNNVYKASNEFDEGIKKEIRRKTLEKLAEL